MNYLSSSNYKALISDLDILLNIVGNNEEHSLMGLVDIISDHIATYEEKRFRKSMGTGIDALKFLMAAHKLKQGDIPKIASQGVLSEILNGKRSLTLRQITLLAKYFNVTPSTFIDNN